MWKIRTIYFLITFQVTIVYAKVVYQSVRVYEPTLSNINIIGMLGIPLEHLSGEKGQYIDITVTEDQTVEMISRGLVLDILIPDLTKYYKARNRPSRGRNFPLGSMQGNYTWDELNSRFDVLLEAYPNIISERTIIGQSVEGNDIWAFKVSDNPNIDEDEPEVLYTSLTHAREPVGMMNLFYFVQHLCENYGMDNEIDFLVNNREMWFIPVINPDGYIYNEEIEPFGGGMHRKNRSETNCGFGTARGVDLNRNYSFGWGTDNIGSSANPCSETYRGTSGFSEPETQAVRDFINGREFMNVLHYHTYSNIYIHPWGSGELPAQPDLNSFNQIGNEMAKYNRYDVGTGLSTIGYTVNGDAVDWTYGSQGLISFTPEVGTYEQGFWPSEDEIIDLCSLQVYPNKLFSLVSGPDLIVFSSQSSLDEFLPGDEIEYSITLQNRGLTSTNSDIEIHVLPINQNLLIESDVYTISSIGARSYADILVSIYIPENIPLGSLAGFIISIESDNSLSRIDTVSFPVGPREIIIVDGFENGLINWNLSGNWGLTTEALTGSFALTDSPEGNYQSNQFTTAKINNITGLNYFTDPTINFNAIWEIQDNRDFVRFQGLDDGMNWITLRGSYTVLGSNQYAQTDEYGYDGIQGSWVNEEIHLNQFQNSNFSELRFVLTSDNSGTGNGFFIDDFSISGVPKFYKGDYNFDGFVDIIDLLGISEVVLLSIDLTPMHLLFCDLNSSGIIDVMDILSLIDRIMDN